MDETRYLTVEEFINENFDERERKEIGFATMYYREFGHGTDGHNRLLLIAKLFHMLISQMLIDEPSPIINDEDLCKNSVLSA